MSQPEPESHESTQTSRRHAEVHRVLVIEGCANVALLILKCAVGFATGSLAILTDAVHTLTDTANNVVAIAVMRVAAQPPDEEHPYGHSKFETLAVFGLATLLTVTAIEIVLHAFRRGDDPVVTSGWALVLMIAALVVHVAVAVWERKQARRLNSTILHADAKHTFGDVLTSVAVIGGWQLAAYFEAAVARLRLRHLESLLWSSISPSTSFGEPCRSSSTR